MVTIKLAEHTSRAIRITACRWTCQQNKKLTLKIKKERHKHQLNKSKGQLNNNAPIRDLHAVDYVVGSVSTPNMNNDFVEEVNKALTDNQQIISLSPTNQIEKAIEFGLSLIGTKYCWWRSGSLVDDSAPAWAGDGLPHRQSIIDKGIFCAGLVNVMLRHIGLKAPTHPPWNGGTYAYGKKFKLHPFSLDHVRRGDAVFRPYFNTKDQGHIGIALGGKNDYLLQSFAENLKSTSPGVNRLYTVEESHCGYYYQYIIKREDLWESDHLGK
eukprot:TRINITY_DN13668_c0_g1_i1.p1 TRINITY_DN13668_c0_g1~~TRINITY_DN13668_c0_g1_i1.p1  ORF type:complete len:269 (+),score=28.38 TRINITY_DN13668_c0_g1_i1:45-851(+)